MTRQRHQPPSQPFDFELWAELAHRSPEAFEELRRLTVDLAILKRSQRNRRRLKGLQWQIDQLRARSGTPLAACLRINDLMWEKFESLNDSYHRPLTGEKRTHRAETVRLRPEKPDSD